MFAALMARYAEYAVAAGARCLIFFAKKHVTKEDPSIAPAPTSSRCRYAVVRGEVRMRGKDETCEADCRFTPRQQREMRDAQRAPAEPAQTTPYAT